MALFLLFIFLLLLFLQCSIRVWLAFLFLIFCPSLSFLALDLSVLDLKNIVFFPEETTSSSSFSGLKEEQDFNSLFFLSWFKNSLILLLVFFCFYWCLPFLLYKLALIFKVLPKISETEKTALNTGDIGIEKDFLIGSIKKKTLLSQKFPVFSQEEKNFLNKQVENLCDLSSEWDFLKRKKLSRQEEEFLKEEKFFGLTLPKKYEGLGFSPLAHAKVIEKIASHNIPLSILTMVPNSIGPAELLLKYGSSTQKEKHLKSLALGKKWPCFGLTESQAGSDASSIQSSAVLFKEKGGINLRVNFEKRWITLSARADLIGLAVQLKDPDQILSDKKDLGITALLIPSSLKGIERGTYHNPMDLPIYNAPIKGVDVVLPAEEGILGGLKQAGKGWKMLIECLSSGRAISLPALAVASSKRCSFLVGTHSFVRRQFRLPISKFEGVESSLAGVFGLTHLITTTHLFTLSSLNQGIVSPVVSALTKYQLTELSQKVIKKSMDIMGGAGLSLGPRNKIASLYKAIPLAITVEGANILTRTFITYGQGLMKLHPQAQSLVQSLEKRDFLLFHKAISRLCYHLFCQFVRFWFYFVFQILLSFFAFFYFKLKSLLYFMTRVDLFKSNPYCAVRKFLVLQKLKYSSTLFSFLSDLSLISLGGTIKKRGQTSGRFADWLSLQYMISSLIWHQRHKKTNPLLTVWGLDYCFLENQNTALALLRNYPQAFCRWLLKPFIWALRIHPLGYDLSDSTGKKLVQQFFKDSDFRKSLCEGMYYPKDPEDQINKLKKAFDLSLKEADILKHKVGGSGKQNSSQKKIYSLEEQELIKQARSARKEAIQVDAFTEEEYFN